MSTFAVGKARISVSVTGCIDCGAVYASGWTHAKTVKLNIEGRQPVELLISRCSDCLGKKPLEGDRR